MHLVPGRQGQVLATVSYAYPAINFAWFILSYIYSVITLQSQDPNVKGRKTRFLHRRLVVLSALLILTYAAFGVELLVDGFFTNAWAPDFLIVGQLSCAVIFVAHFSYLLGNRRTVWWPLWGSWAFTAGMEAVVALLVAGQSMPIFTTRQMIFYLSLTALREVILVLLVFGSSRAERSFVVKATDEESQGLMAESTINGNTAQTDGANGQASYGATHQANGKAKAKDDDSDSDSDSDSEDEEVSEWETRWEQRTQGLKDRLKESGSWITYAKEYSVLLPYVVPSANMRLQLRLAGVIVCLLLSNVLNLLIPRQTGIIIDKLNNSGSAGVWGALWVYVGLRVLSSEAGLDLLQTRLWLPVQYYSQEHMTQAIYAKILHLSADFHDSKNSSDMNQAIWGGSSIFDIFENLLLNAIPMLIDLTVALVYLSVTFGPYEGLITMATGVAFLFLARRLVAESRAATKARRNTIYQEHYLRYSGLDGWHTVAAFNQVGYEVNRHADAVTSRYAAEMNHSLSWQVSIAIQSTALLLGFIASAILAVSRIRSGKASPGQFAMLLMYWTQLTSPLKWFAGLGKRFSDNFIDAEHTLTIMRTEAKVKNRPAARPLKLVAGHIKFDKISFSYDDKKDILKDVTLDVPAGKTIAFVGATGAGKSTMLKLLNRFYDVTDGSISIDGQDIRDVNLGSLRDKIGVVPQSPDLFDDTILNNVRYGSITATDEEVYEACRAACIHDKILDFTKGYATRVGRRGVKLSGGELQRAAIARAILKKPDIVLLDEATSAVDTETEHLIQQSLKRLCKDRTTLVVAHRLSTIMNADRIVVIDKGQIIESGSHDELLEQKGKYHSLWSKQVFLKPKEPKADEGEGENESGMVNDLTTEQNAAEIAKLKSQSPTDDKNGEAGAGDAQES